MKAADPDLFPNIRKLLVAGSISLLAGIGRCHIFTFVKPVRCTLRCTRIPYVDIVAKKKLLRIIGSSQPEVFYQKGVLKEHFFIEHLQ